MPTENEKAIRKGLSKLDAALTAASPDVQDCRAAFSTLRGHVEELLGGHSSPTSLSARSWSDALLAQARDDLRAVEIIAGASRGRITRGRGGSGGTMRVTIDSSKCERSAGKASDATSGTTTTAATTSVCAAKDRGTV